MKKKVILSKKDMELKTVQIYHYIKRNKKFTFNELQEKFEVTYKHLLHILRDIKKIYKLDIEKHYFYMIIENR